MGPLARESPCMSKHTLNIQNVQVRAQLEHRIYKPDHTVYTYNVYKHTAFILIVELLTVEQTL
jgi:hypothetical protein